MTSGNFPDEPHLRSEPALLSPASPKPLHFPAPTNIPVLDKMMDVQWNQTEVHMDDPAMHNTELRPGAWQDPNASGADAGQASSGGEGAAVDTTAAAPEGQTANQASASDAVPNMPNSQNASPQGVSDESVAQPTASFEPTSSTTEFASHNTNVSAQPSENGYVQTSAPPRNGEVDVQALLQTLQTNSAHVNSTPTGESVNVGTALSPSQNHQYGAIGTVSSDVSASGLGAPPSGLPARPPPQEQPLINANYSQSQHIRDYHPDAAYQNNNNRSSQAPAAPSSASHTFVPPVHVSAEPTASGGADPSFNNPTPSITQEQQAMYGANLNRMHGSTPLESRREYKIAAGLNLSEDDQPWTADTQRKYDKFIEDERKYVSEGRWEQFPYGSRLFVGNLSSERVTKRDIFHAFHRYGDLAQISIKQAYGFVQFLRPQDCSVALSREEGRQIRGKKIHLEVSKPQRNRIPQQDSRPNQSPINTRRQSPLDTRRRSRSPRSPRSPDYGRGGNDRFVGGRMGYGGRDVRDGRDGRDRERDGYRQQYRSPSPRERYHNDRYRDRSPGYGRGGRFSRAASPTDSDDGLPLPKRAPQNVPDVQIISSENLNRDFINWIEQAFQARGLTVDVLYLSPRLDFDAVVRRQLVEGVLAVCRLNRGNQDTGLINLRLFDRTGAGANNIKFDDYDRQDLQICVELVSRKKQSMWGHQPPQQPSYGYNQQPPPAYGMPPSHPPGFPPGYGAPPSHTPAGSAPPGPSVPPNLQQLITSLDPKGLQNLLAAMQPVGSPHAYTPQQPFAPHQQAAITALQHNPGALAGYLQQQSLQQPPVSPGQQPVPQNGGGQVNMQEILARLGTYK